jgi:hypothetical protein
MGGSVNRVGDGMGLCGRAWSLERWRLRSGRHRHACVGLAWWPRGRMRVLLEVMWRMLLLVGHRRSIPAIIRLYIRLLIL